MWIHWYVFMSIEKRSFVINFFSLYHDVMIWHVYLSVDVQESCRGTNNVFIQLSISSFRNMLCNKL